MADPVVKQREQNHSPEAADERAAILAELGEIEKKGKAPPAPSKKPAAAEETEAEPTDEAAAEGEEPTDAPADEDAEESAEGEESDDEKSDDEPSPDEDEDDAEGDDEKPDPATARGLTAVQKAAAREKAKFAEEKKAARAELEARAAQIEAEWKPRVEAAKKFEAAASKRDVIGMLTAAGIGEDDFENIARVVYAHSKAGQAANPQARELAARTARERAAQDELVATQKRLADLEAKFTAQAAREAADREAAAFLTGLEKKAKSAEAPLARHFLGKNPEKTRARLSQIAATLLEETGDMPDHDDVLARYETDRRAELEELGVDVATIIKTTPKPKNKTKTAEEKRPAKTLGNNLSTTTPVPRSEAQSDEELKQEILRDLRKLDAEAVD